MASADLTGPEDDRNGEDPLDLGADQIEPDQFQPDPFQPGQIQPASPGSETELALGEDVRLPWLQSDDDDEEEVQGYGGGQIAMLVLLALAALGVIVGGIWWATHRQTDDVLVADGGVIEAPAEPYKTKPADPGGKTFEGTGDTSFAVSEGQTRPARLGQQAPKSAAVPTPAASASAGSAGAPEDASGIGVQIGAYSTRASAEAAWTRLSQQYDALSGKRHRIVEGKADIGTVYRLQALEASAAAANGLCRGLKSSGLACQVKQ
jgi:nitrogen fixation-related uncharacterized protein